MACQFLAQSVSSPPRAKSSPIFKWYGKDFDCYPGGREGFLWKHAPLQGATELAHKGLEITFLKYDWGLNDQSEVGRNYSRLQFGFDGFRNWFHSLGGI